jgi:hypothetical protein
VKKRNIILFAGLIILSAIFIVLLIFEISRGYFPSLSISILMLVMGIVGLLYYFTSDEEKVDKENDRKILIILADIRLLIGSVALIIIGAFLLISKA